MVARDLTTTITVPTRPRLGSNLPNGGKRTEPIIRAEAGVGWHMTPDSSLG